MLAFAKSLFGSANERKVKSMGGRIAWTFAATQPARVDKLVLLSPDGFASPGFEYGKPPEVPACMAGQTTGCVGGTMGVIMIVVMIMGFDAGGAGAGRICVRIGHLERRSGAFRWGNQCMRNSITLFTLRRCCGVCSAG